MTLSTRLRAWADRIDRFRGHELEPLPLLAGTKPAGAVALILALGGDGRWYNAVASWVDPSIGKWLDSCGDPHSGHCAVVYSEDGLMPADLSARKAFLGWAMRQLARGAEERRMQSGRMVIVSPGAPWKVTTEELARL